MHQIEIGNNVEMHQMTIINANRATLTLDILGHVEVVTTGDYVEFARSLTSVYHQLEGRAELVNETGRAILTLSFKRGLVDVCIVRGASVRMFQTDQSYVTIMVRQIGVME